MMKVRKTRATTTVGGLRALKKFWQRREVYVIAGRYTDYGYGFCAIGAISQIYDCSALDAEQSDLAIALEAVNDMEVYDVIAYSDQAIAGRSRPKPAMIEWIDRAIELESA